MSSVSDKNSSPFDLFVQASAPSTYVGTATPKGPGYTGTGLNGIPDYSYDTLCGTRFSTNDGRQVVLARNAGTAIGSGLLVQAPAETTGYNDLVITVPATAPATAGTYQILVTNGATVVNENMFSGGYLITSLDTGAGQTLQIASNQPAAASGTFLVTLVDPIQVTLDATTNVTLVPNPYLNTVVSATGLTGIAIGSTFYAVSASTPATFNATSGALTSAGVPVYYFLGCHGLWGIRVDATNTPAVGLPVSASTTTAGDYTVFTAAKQYIGNAAGTGTSAHYCPVDLKL